MANITLKDVPEDLHARLRAVARETGRSLNKMILTLLDRSMGSGRSDRLELLDRIRSRRVTLRPFVDDAGVEAAIDEGRA